MAGGEYECIPEGVASYEVIGDTGLCFTLYYLFFIEIRADDD